MYLVTTQSAKILLLGFCELAHKPMWSFIFSQKFRKVSESQEICTAYFFCWELYLFWLTPYPYSPCLLVNGNIGLSALPKIKKRKRGVDDKLKP